MFRERKLQIYPSDILVVVTDGVTEARRVDGDRLDFFGSTGVVRAALAVGRARQNPARAITRAAIEHAQGRVTDDATAFVSRLRPAPNLRLVAPRGHRNRAPSRRVSRDTMSAIPEISQARSRPTCWHPTSRFWSISGRRGAGRARCSRRSSRKSPDRWPVKAKFVKLNTDENPNIAAQYGISGIPTLILFKGGEVVDRIVGFVPKSAITSMISKHLVTA